MDVSAKPFVKWAGGKSQLLKTFEGFYPEQLYTGRITRYVEPFVGSGAVLFHILQNFIVQEAHIIDTNKELINTYRVIKDDVEQLIICLEQKEKEYLPLNDKERKEYYYQARIDFNRDINEFNLCKDSIRSIERACLFLFLNRTCYNGLYRVNSEGLFNVPIGRYKNPLICDRNNLSAVSNLLKRVTILEGPYTLCSSFIDENTFVYFDPPYMPLNETAHFTSYCKEKFSAKDQKNLSDFYRSLDLKKAWLMLSNSDPKNVDCSNVFFEDLYHGFYIHRVEARRAINCNATKRGTLSELVITNYPVRNINTIKAVSDCCEPDSNSNS